MECGLNCMNFNYGLIKADQDWNAQSTACCWTELEWIDPPPTPSQTLGVRWPVFGWNRCVVRLDWARHGLGLVGSEVGLGWNFRTAPRPMIHIPQRRLWKKSRLEWDMDKSNWTWLVWVYLDWTGLSLAEFGYAGLGWFGLSLVFILVELGLGWVELGVTESISYISGSDKPCPVHTNSSNHYNLTQTSTSS